MYGYQRSFSLSFNVVDKLTEDAYTMMDQQDNKTRCIRKMLLDFVNANGIILDYNTIPQNERLKKFYGIIDPEKVANAPQPDKREKDGHKYRFQFNLYATDRLANETLVMLNLQNNKALLIRELFLDFVKANGIIKNYASIPENERLERFFAYVVRDVVPVPQYGWAVKTLKDKNIEVLQCYDGTHYLTSKITYKAPDGKQVCITI